MTADHLTHTHDLQHWMTTVLDTRDCARFEIVVPLLEHESAGLMFETWPAQVRNQVTKYLREWHAANEAARAVRAISYGLADDHGGKCCVVVVHHAAKQGA
jgi:hypothetical protein